MRATITTVGLAHGSLSGAQFDTTLGTTQTRSASMGSCSAHFSSWRETHTIRVVQAAKAVSANRACHLANRFASGLNPKPCTV